MDTFLFDRRLRRRSTSFEGKLSLCIDFLIASIGAESNALAMSREANQNSLLSTLAALIAESTIVSGSMVLWSGRPAKLNSERILLSFKDFVSLLLIMPVKIFLDESTKAIGLVSLSL